MLKRKAGRKFSRNTNSRRAMFRSLVRNLVLNGQVVTTETKAKTVSRMVDKVFNKAKKDTLASKRSIIATLGNDREVFKKLSEYKNLIDSRKSGFTKFTRISKRKGDNATLVRFELAMPKDESLATETKEKTTEK